MEWKPRIAWALLSMLVALTAWELTRWVTRVHRDAGSELAAVYNASASQRLSLTLSGLTLEQLRRNRYRIPGVVVSGYRQALFVITPATLSFGFDNLKPSELSCGFMAQIFTGASPVALAGAVRRTRLEHLELVSTPSGGTIIPVPAALHAALERSSQGQGAIACSFVHLLAGATTFTDRSLTISVRGLKGIFMLDVSALEDLDDLRFAGGVAFPLAGDRTRFLDGTDNVVSIEWVDVASQERRDVILVVAGALFAICAATAIEAVRPFIER